MLHLHFLRSMWWFKSLITPYHAWSQLLEFLEGLGSVILLEEVCHSGVGFEVSKAHTISS